MFEHPVGGHPEVPEEASYADGAMIILAAEGVYFDPPSQENACNSQHYHEGSADGQPRDVHPEDAQSHDADLEHLGNRSREEIENAIDRQLLAAFVQPDLLAVPAATHFLHGAAPQRFLDGEGSKRIWTANVQDEGHHHGKTSHEAPPHDGEIVKDVLIHRRVMNAIIIAE